MNPGKLITFALVAQLLAAPVTSGMLVLCFGSDGHVAVESASSDLCCREWETVHRDSSAEFPMTIGSSSSVPCCNDLELSVESATLTVPSQKIIPASIPPCRVAVSDSPLRTANSATFPLPTESPVAASLRTVVLQA